MKYARTVLTILVPVAFAAYLVAFYATPMPSVEQAAGRAFRRIDFLEFAIWPEHLISLWFGSPPEFAVWDRLPVLLLAGSILGCATLLGWLLMSLCRADRGLSRLETFTFSAAVGLNLLSTFTLLMGLLGWLNRWTVAAPALLIAIAAGLRWRQHRSSAHPPSPLSLPPSLVPPPSIPAPLTARWLWLALPFALVILLGAMLPPGDFDVREYHLQAPKEFYQQGWIAFLPHNVYANMPLGAEMLSLLAMVLAGDWWLGALAGKTVVALLALLTALALFTAGRRFASTTVGVVAAVVYVSTPWIVSVSISGLIDGAVAFYAWMALYALLLWRGGGSRAHLALAGYLAGGAVACKYPAALFVAVPLAGTVPVFARGTVPIFARAKMGLSPSHADRPKQAGCLLYDRATLRTVCRSLAIFLLALALGCGLWFGKNWALAGNPTYPLLYGVFDGRTWTPEKDQQWNRVHRPHDFSAWAVGDGLYRVLLGSEWLSPLLVPLAALSFFAVGQVSLSPFAPRKTAAFAERKATKPSYALTLGLAAYVAWVLATWWFFTHRIDRFWIPALPAVALLAGLGACWNAGRAWRRALQVLLAACAAANLLVASFACGYSAFFVSLQSARTDPARVDAWHRFFNREFAAGRFHGKLLLVGDAQPFDLEMPVIYSTCFDDCPLEEIVSGRSPAEVRAELAARGIGCVYVHWGEIKRYRRTYGFSDFVEPAVFQRLVEQGVLLPLPPIEGHSSEGFLVPVGVSPSGSADL